MIYVASHTVRSRQLSMREGVNAFIYQPDAVPNDMAVSVAMEKLSDAPGRMTGCSIELPPGIYRVEGEIGPDLLALVTTWCADQGVLPRELSTGRRSLEDVFLDLTGRELRT